MVSSDFREVGKEELRNFLHQIADTVCMLYACVNVCQCVCPTM